MAQIAEVYIFICHFTVALVLFYGKIFGGKKLQNKALTSTSELVIGSFPRGILVSFKKESKKEKKKHQPRKHDCCPSNKDTFHHPENKVQHQTE